jgi:hypothetical protein
LGGDELLNIAKQDPVAPMAPITTSLLEPMHVEGGIMVAVRASVESAAFPEVPKAPPGKTPVTGSGQPTTGCMR